MIVVLSEFLFMLKGVTSLVLGAILGFLRYIIT